MVPVSETGQDILVKNFLFVDDVMALQVDV